jgi:gamma-glutamylcyclotransferase (GGCT)/AIG2-like uncharacterized protein YtfP
LPKVRDPVILEAHAMGESDHRLFVYGTLLEGQRDHGLLEGRTRIGACTTEAAFHLVDLGAYAALVPGGATSVAGELYLVDLRTIVAIDVAQQVPVLFARARVRLSDGTEAETHVMTADQVRGRRRLHHGDWRKRFSGHEAPVAGPFAQWARSRSSR